MACAGPVVDNTPPKFSLDGAAFCRRCCGARNERQEERRQAQRPQRGSYVDAAPQPSPADMVAQYEARKREIEDANRRRSGVR